MKTLLIINLILVSLTILYLLYRDLLYRLKFSFVRTIWTKRIIGIEVIWWDKNLVSGHGIFGKRNYDDKKDYAEYLKTK